MARPNRAFADITVAIAATVTTDADGWGRFTCNAASVSVWV